MIAAIELAMLARLQEVAAAGLLPFPRWKTLATFPEDFEDYLQSTAVISCPAAWVVFTGWGSVERQQLEDDNQQLVAEASFAVLVGAENNRPDEQFQRHGGADPAIEPGSYHLILAAVASLAGQTLGLDLVRPLEAGRLSPVVPTAASRKAKVSRYACEFSCSFAIVLTPSGPIPADLELLHANWDIPPFDTPSPIDRLPATPGRQLPDDFHAKATDHVSLETD